LKPTQKGKEEAVDWHRSDLSYIHLHQIKMQASYFAGSGDLPGWCNALEAEYRFVWYYIDKYAKKDEINKESFDSAFKEIRRLLFDPRYKKYNTPINRLKSRNYARAREYLSEVTMLFNKYEMVAGLSITTDKIRDPYKAIMQYGG
jgi:hypothetical protein|tara:strand:+ start:45 stop:482 length:438 start_codon:yes stop_codon:yes gene_type:complete